MGWQKKREEERRDKQMKRGIIRKVVRGKKGTKRRGEM